VSLDLHRHPLRSTTSTLVKIKSTCTSALLLRQYEAFINSRDSDASYMKAIKQFNGIDFPLWKKMIEGILEFLELDYVLYTVKPFPPTSGIENYDEKMYEYHFKLEQWEKDNKLAKRIIKRSISDGIRGVFL